MGTTKTALETDAGTVVEYVLAIEGWEYLLTTCSSTAAVVTAWAGTAWSQGLAGLMVPQSFTQSIEPFRPRIEASTMQFVVLPDEAETFARAVWTPFKATGAVARMNADVDVNDTTFSYDETSELAASGTLYVGTERTTYSGKTATTTTGHTRGTFAPFGRSSDGKWGRPHRIGQAANATVVKPFVTDYPVTWVGRWVGLWVHRVLGGVLDVKAEAQLVFAGRIADIVDGESGETAIACTDAREAVGSAVLLGDQYQALPQRGGSLTSDDYFVATEWHQVQATGALTQNRRHVQVGVTGYIAAGYNTSDDLTSGLNEWLAAEMAAAELDFDWHVQRESGGHTQVITDYTGTNVRASTWIAMSPRIANLLGFYSDGDGDRIDPATGLASTGGVTAKTFRADEIGDDPRTILVSQYSVSEVVWLAEGLVAEVVIDNSVGTWIDQTDYLPEPYRSRLLAYDSAGVWGFVDVAGFLFGARKDSDTQFTLFAIPDAGLFAGIERPAIDLFGRNADKKGQESAVLRQVILLEGRTEDVILRLVLSTGVADYNVADLDAYERQLGAAIPWGITGSPFEESVRDLAALAPATSMTVLIDRPTRLQDVLLPEMMLRNAHLVFRDEHLVFVVPATPSSTTADYALTPTTKAARPDAGPDRTRVELSRAPMVNQIKIEYARDLGGTYHGVLEIANEQSKTEFGIAQAVTVRARNTFSSDREVGSSVEALAASLAATAMSVFARPLVIATTSISAARFLMVPGDTVTVYDNSLRDRTTGARGVTGELGWVLSVAGNWATGIGEARVVMLGVEAARIGDLAPVGELSSYDAGNKDLVVADNTHSLSSEDTDGSRFAVGDKVRVIEVSPANPASPLTWVDEVASIPVAGTLRLTTGDGGVYDAAKTFRVTYQERSAVVTAQQTRAYLADHTDGRIEGTDRAKLWTSPQLNRLATAAPDPSDPHEYPSDLESAEGAPVHAGTLRNMVRTANNLLNYKMAIQCPYLPNLDTGVAGGQSGAFHHVMQFPLWLPGAVPFGASLTRKLYIAPRASIANAAHTATIRVTIAKRMPAGDFNSITPLSSDFVSVDFTHTGNTTVTNLARSSVDVAGFLGAICYVIVEAKSSGASAAEFYGLPEFWLGPLEAP